MSNKYIFAWYEYDLCCLTFMEGSPLEIQKRQIMERHDIEESFSAL